jgi:hypothetical protein
MKEQKRLASINLTKAGFEAMEALTKKTQLSRKEVVSKSLEDSLNGTKNETIVKFKFSDPILVIELRKEIIALESAADTLRKALYSIRPRDDKQADKIGNILYQIQDMLPAFERIGETLKEKHRLLDGLTPADHAALPAILPWLNNLRKSAEGQPDKAKRLARHDLIERLVKLAV